MAGENSRLELLAADLAGAQVDPNEAQKALAYLRSVRDPRRFFDYLRAINQDGRAVIRSNQTLGYYRELLAACERHLRGLDAQEMAYTLGWAIRLLRYYRVVPQASRPHLAPARAEERRPAAPMAEPPPPPPPAKSGPELPAVGETFTGKITEMDASMAILAVPGFLAEKAIGLLSADVADLRRYKVGNAARVEVIEQKTQRSGRVLLIVRPAPKKAES